MIVGGEVREMVPLVDQESSRRSKSDGGNGETIEVVRGSGCTRLEKCDGLS